MPLNSKSQQFPGFTSATVAFAGETMTKSNTAKKQKTTRWLEISALDDGIRPWGSPDRTPKAETTRLPFAGPAAITLGVRQGALRSIEEPGDELMRERKALIYAARLPRKGELPAVMEAFIRDAMAGDNVAVVSAARAAICNFANLEQPDDFSDEISF